MRAFSSCGKQGLLSSCVLRLLIVEASFLRHTGSGGWVSVVAAHELSCPLACGIFLRQGMNVCHLEWKVES